MTSKVFWNAGIILEDDLGLEDTFRIMSSADFDSPLLDDLDLCKNDIMSAPRNAGQPSDSQQVTGGNNEAQNVQDQSSTSHEAIGAPAAGGAAGSGGDGRRGGGGGNERGGQGAADEDDSHENQSIGSSSTSSGSVPPLLHPSNLLPPPQIVPWSCMTPPDDNRNGSYENGNHSEGSGISDATTARVSDTEGHGQIVVRTSADHGSSSVKQPSSGSSIMTSAGSSCARAALKPVCESLDISSTTASTLSSLTTSTSSTSSGHDDKKSLSTDASFHLDSSKLELSCAGDHTDILHQQSIAEKVPEFPISQEDMFSGAGERFTSTPSETVGILGFSQTPVTENLDEDNDLIIPPSPDAYDDVPFLFPGTPSVAPTEELKPTGSEKQGEKRPSSLELTKLDENPRKKISGELQLHARAVASDDFSIPDASRKKPSQKAAAAAKIGGYLLKRTDPQTSHGVQERNAEDITASPKVSENVICKIPFDSTSDSQESSSDASGKNLNPLGRPTCVPFIRQLAKSSSSDSVGDSKVTEVGSERSPSDNLIFNQLYMEDIDLLGKPVGDSKQTGMSSSKPVSGKLYRMKPKLAVGVDSNGEKSAVKSPSKQLNLKKEFQARQQLLQKEDEDVTTPESPKELEESDEMQADEDLFLHYSPSQKMESQYFPLTEEMASCEVAETEQDSESCTFNDKENQLKPPENSETVPESENYGIAVGSVHSLAMPSIDANLKLPSEVDMLKGKLTEDIPSFKTCLSIEDIQYNVSDPNSNDMVEQPSFHLQTSQAGDTSNEEICKESTKQMPEEEKNLPGPSGLQTQGHTLLYEERMSDEQNPFESASDEPDAPVCPVGRHKRQLGWSTDSDTPASQPASVKKQKISNKSISCQADIRPDSDNCISKPNLTVVHPPKIEHQCKDQAVQTIDDTEAKGNNQIVSEACDTTDGTGITRRTVIITRLVIEEKLRHGKVIKRTTEEVKEEPIITEFRDDGENEADVFTQPTPGKPSPESSIASKSTSTSSLNKSASSGSHTSGWLGDISSSKSSSCSSLNKQTPTPYKRIPSGDVASISKQSSPPIEHKSISGMKTLRSVKRRQCYEIKKTLNLSSPETATPVKSIEAASVSTPSPKYNNSSCSSTLDEMTEKISPPKRQKKKMAVSPIATAGVEARVTPVKRPGKASKRGKQGAAKERPIESGKVTPKKVVKIAMSRTPTKEIAQPSTSCQPSTPTSQEYLGSLRPGVRVMARWRDGFYYPGQVLERESNDSWLIMYDDSDARSIKEGNILVVDVLPLGQSVYAESPDGYFDSGLIVEQYQDKDETGYKVEIDSGVVRKVPRNKVILTRDQAACLETLPDNMMHGYTSICLDNILEGSRRNRGTSRDSSTPSTPRTPRTPRLPRKATSSSKSTPETNNASSSDEMDPSPSNKHSAKPPKRTK